MQINPTIQTFTIGQIENNTYLLADPGSQKAVVIDPAAGIETVIADLNTQKLALAAIWITHAHFDHIAGVSPLLKTFGNDIPVFLHPDDLPLWQAGGGAKDFGVDFNPGAQPNASFFNGQHITFGDLTFEVRHTPGHSPGHVVLYCQTIKTAFCGDLIFYHGVGRTDLPYGDSDVLLQSIHQQIFTLPDATALLCGHGPATTVGEERRNNPFLN